MTITTPDRIRGLLFGLASGDQIGGPIRMAIELSKSLLDKNSFDKKSVLRHYYTWWDETGFDAGYIAHKVFQKMKQQQLNQEAVQEVHQLTGGMTGGCNPMHRASPLSLLYPATDKQLKHYARQEASLTRYDSVAGECSLFIVRLCRSLLEGQSIQDSLSDVYRTSADSLTIVNELSDLIDFQKGRSQLNKKLSNGGYSIDVLRASIYFIKTQTSFESALSSSITFAGGANFCPVTVGVIAGVQYGYNAIPDKFMKHPTLVSELNNIADQFLERWNC